MTIFPAAPNRGLRPPIYEAAGLNGALMQGQFDFEARVLMCSNCGAPVETCFAGGTVRCDYCGTTNIFEARREAPVEPRDATREMSENERLELLVDPRDPRHVSVVD